MNWKKSVPWLIWLSITSVAAVYLYLKMQGDDKEMFLIGSMTHGHYQIEMACTACHTDAFGGGALLQDACVKCHGAELKQANDAHPKSKFTDPRNADRVAILDARQCITCHTEHQPELNRKMGLTLPDDYCAYCHRDIEKDRPSHKGLKFDTCASAGCHNFHDNRALYEDFLVKHFGEPEFKPGSVLMSRNLREYLEHEQGKKFSPSGLQQMDDLPGVRVDQLIKEEWVSTAHAKSGVNCKDCHQANGKSKPAKGEWLSHPDHTSCSRCHQDEVNGFLSGKHGMRLKQGLSAMRPEMARGTMQTAAGHRELGCNSCHKAHTYDTKQAAVESCLSCHADEHSQAYKQSPHYRLMLKELGGELPKGSGVSCASCHMPRTVVREGDFVRVQVQHNQNDNLRPNEKMIRSVCMSCHGLAFSIDALADEKLLKNNFKGKPAAHVPGIDWAKKREKGAAKGMH